MASIGKQIPWGEVILYGGLGLGALFIVKGVLEGIEHSAQNVTQETTDAAVAGVKTVSGAVKQGLSTVGEGLDILGRDLVQAWDIVTHQEPTQEYDDQLSPGSGPLVGNSGSSSTQVSTPQGANGAQQ